MSYLQTTRYAYGVRELHDYWCLPPRSLVVVYFGREISTTVTSVVKCSMLTLLQPLPVVPFPPSVRASFPSKAAGDASGLRAAPHPHALLEANAAKPETTGYAQYPPPPLMRYSAINLICSSPTTASRKYLDVTFISLK